MPAVFATAPGSHSAGRPSAHGRQWPQLGTKTSTTWSPFFEVVDARARAASTTPAASWPRAIGMGRGRSPLITDRSEWQRPAAPICTRISPGPGGFSSTSSILSGFDFAYGAWRPHRLEDCGADFQMIFSGTGGCAECLQALR